MRPFFFVLLTLLFAACSTSPSEEQGTPVPDASVAIAVVDWPGYYEGVFPVGNGKEVTVQLWIRSDSTFVVRKRHSENDALAEGAIGIWRVVKVAGGPAAGLLSIHYFGDPPEFYQRTDKGLILVDVAGGAEAATDHFLERLADELQDEIPRMKLAGTFTYMADAMSFQPCGSTFSWPAAGGEQWTDEGKVLGSLNSADLQQHYLRSVSHGDDPWIIEVECTMAMGPSMEGDGADEYIFIHRVLGTTQCP